MIGAWISSPVRTRLHQPLPQALDGASFHARRRPLFHVLLGPEGDEGEGHMGDYPLITPSLELMHAFKHVVAVKAFLVPGLIESA